MSIKKSVHVNLFGSGGDSLEWATEWLEIYAKNIIPDYVEQGLTTIGALAAMNAEIAYGDADVSMEYATQNNMLTVTATGPEVVFWEFGTGTYADPAQELAGNTSALGFDVYPGSWSEGPEGKLKYYMVKYGGMSMDEWPYTKVPRRAMLAAYNAVKQQYQNLMQGAFEK